MPKVIYSKKINVDDNWYYHSFNENKLDSFLEKGILCPLLLHKYPGSYNGLFYISVNKRNNKKNSSYKFFTDNNYPMFIIHNVKAYETNSKLGNLFTLSPIPIRKSPYCDEYQIFYKIKLEQIKAIKISDVNDLKLLKSILISLDKNNKDIPLYHIDENNNEFYEIEKEKTLKLIY